jgi:hypothetical protein
MAVHTAPLITNGLISIDGKTDYVLFHKAIAHLFFYLIFFIFCNGDISEVLALSANSVTTTEHRIQGYDLLTSEHLLPCTPT